MSHFQPTKTSSPVKRITHRVHRGPESLLSDISRTTAASASSEALRALTPEDIEFLDDVIRRTSSEATTFLNVFKAYNDVLQERGIDPQHEVRFYGKLLKLGNLKGSSWAEKWRTIKANQDQLVTYTPFKGSKPNAVRTTATLSETNLALRRNPLSSLGDDLVTADSHQDGTDSVFTDNTTDAPFNSYRNIAPQTTGRNIRYEFSSFGASTSALSLDHLSDDTPQRSSERLWGKVSDTTESAPTHSVTTLPSYGRANRNKMTPQDNLSTFVARKRRASLPQSEQPAFSDVKTRERAKSVLNADEAWFKVKVLQDEKDADLFRNDKTVERCWAVWRSGYQWVIKTNDHIATARDSLIVRIALQKWRRKTAQCTELLQRVIILEHKRRLRSVFSMWTKHLQEKRRADWRLAIRAKLKTMREQIEGRMLKDAWFIWRQMYGSHIAGLDYKAKLVRKSYARWKTTLARVDGLYENADMLRENQNSDRVESLWKTWKTLARLMSIERSLMARKKQRVLKQAMLTWQTQTDDAIYANTVSMRNLLQKAWSRWQIAIERIELLNNRADKYIARQDGGLLRAVCKVWRARERSRITERVRALRLMRTAWNTWENRIVQVRQKEDLAISFTHRSKLTLSRAFHTWQRVLETHRNANIFASQYYRVQLSYRVVLAWRLKLRSQLRQVKQAKKAEKFFLRKKAWQIWRCRILEQHREKALKSLESTKLRSVFTAWKRLAGESKERRASEQTVHARVISRIKSETLTFWINRVIEVKDREYEVIRSYNTFIVATAWEKWKAICDRNEERYSLMQSQREVSQQENLKRVFHRWLTTARATRHRRLTLQRLERGKSQANLQAAWDHWRERFIDIGLRHTEHQVILLSHHNLLFRAYARWQSETKSVPAIRFYTSRAKTRAWDLWRRTMPQALRGRQAREWDKKNTLGFYLERWLQKCRTKVALRAVARARYMRLPSPAARPFVSPMFMPKEPRLQAPSAVSQHRRRSPVRSPKSRRANAARIHEPTKHSSTLSARFPPRPMSETGLNGPISNRKRRQDSPTRDSESSLARADSFRSQPIKRERERRSSPTISVHTEDGPRSNLWLALRNVQSHRKLPSEASRP